MVACVLTFRQIVMNVKAEISFKFNAGEQFVLQALAQLVLEVHVRP
jgi:hypothetical protein